MIAFPAEEKRNAKEKKKGGGGGSNLVLAVGKSGRFINWLGTCYTREMGKHALLRLFFFRFVIPNIAPSNRRKKDGRMGPLWRLQHPPRWVHIDRHVRKSNQMRAQESSLNTRHKMGKKISD